MPNNSLHDKQEGPLKRTSSSSTLVDSYRALKPRLDLLAEEIRFSLGNRLLKDDVKIHELQVRIKTEDSFLQKASDKECDDISDIGDLVGCRIVCLFRSDLQRITDILRDEFLVINVDDKVTQHSSDFGYMSIHCECMLNSEHSGPRYDPIKGLKFEAQVRTIGMHAWASVSHYLEYKGEWDAPEALKKDLNALSALFYVADSQFESLFQHKMRSAAQAVDNAGNERLNSEPINFETVSAFIDDFIPNRHVSGASYISELVKEIVDSGYKDMDEVSDDVRRGYPALVSLEIERGREFQSVGVIRMALGMANQSYRECNYRHDDEDFIDHEHLVIAKD